jgi:hypothetical protein
VPTDRLRVSECSDSAGDTVIRDRWSMAVRIIAVLGIVIVVAFESYGVVTHSTHWRDWVHLVTAAGAIGYLACAVRNGRWNICANQKRVSIRTHNSLK